MVPFLSSYLYSNTSHVIVYRCLSKRNGKPTSIQIHLMLLFIWSLTPNTPQSLRIQIHLMLLFIQSGTGRSSDLTDSNTSHVIVYRFPQNQSQDQKRFKYISCYCLSLFQYQLLFLPADSNTSHVIVYPVLGLD